MHFRVRVEFKGNGFDSDVAAGTGLSLDMYVENTSTFSPMNGINRAVVGDELAISKTTGDLVYTDYVNDSSLLLVDNGSGTPSIPAESLGLASGEGVSIVGKTINVDLKNQESGLEFDTTGLAVDLGTSSGLEIVSTGLKTKLSTTTSGLAVDTSGNLEVSLASDGGIAKNTTGRLELNFAANGGLAHDLDGIYVTLELVLVLTQQVYSLMLILVVVLVLMQ